MHHLLKHIYLRHKFAVLFGYVASRCRHIFQARLHSYRHSFLASFISSIINSRDTIPLPRSMTVLVSSLFCHDTLGVDIPSVTLSYTLARNPCRIKPSNQNFTVGRSRFMSRRQRDARRFKPCGTMLFISLHIDIWYILPRATIPFNKNLSPSSHLCGRI